MEIPRPAAVLKEAVTHQAQALRTLILLMDERGIRCDALHLHLVGSSSLQQLGSAQSGRPGAGTVSSTPLTLSQKASRNRMSRVARCCLDLLAVEDNIVVHLPLGHQLPIHLKDSIEFRNICTHMALQTDDRRFDQDLNSAQECLITIINNMNWDVAANSCDFCETVREQLKQILQELHER
ncbi:leukemia-associated protein 7 [Pseudophryne corroboree]|uniref:leukemia-associated protein 7 n=1 Tax=Pseudophryne corroboree TaxID=495146 RepID=UPI003081A1C3